MELRLGRLPEDKEIHSVNYTNPTRQTLVRAASPTALVLAKSVISFMRKYNFEDISIVYPQLNKVSAGKILEGSESFHAAPVEKHRQYDCFEYVDALEEQLFAEKLCKSKRKSKNDGFDENCQIHVHTHTWTYGRLEKGRFYWNEDQLDEILQSIKKEARLVFHCLDPIAIGKRK